MLKQQHNYRVSGTATLYYGYVYETGVMIMTEIVTQVK